MDRTFAELSFMHFAPGRDRRGFGSTLHPHLCLDVWRDSAPLSSAAARRARHVSPARHGPERNRYLPRRRFRQPGHIQPNFQRGGGRIADSLPPKRARPGGTDMLSDGVGSTEQFWRSVPQQAAARMSDDSQGIAYICSKTLTSLTFS